MNKKQRVRLYNQIMNNLSKIVKNHLDEAFNMYNAGLSYGSMDDIDLLNANNDAYDGNDYGDHSDDNDYKNYLKKKYAILKYTDKLAGKDEPGSYCNNINIDRFDGQMKSVLKKYPFLLASKYMNKIRGLKWLDDYIRLSRITSKCANDRDIAFWLEFGKGTSGKKYTRSINRRIFNIYEVIESFIEQFDDLDYVDVKTEYEKFLDDLSHFNHIRAKVSIISPIEMRIIDCFTEMYYATHNVPRKHFWDYPSDFFIIKDMNLFVKCWIDCVERY